jgi:hypothetical protein
MTLLGTVGSGRFWFAKLEATPLASPASSVPFTDQMTCE